MVHSQDEKSQLTDEKNKPTEEKKPTPKIDEYQLGIWRLMIQQDVMFDIRRFWDSFLQGLPLFYQLSVEIWSIAPRLFTLFILTQLWHGIEDAFQMHFSTRLLKLVCGNRALLSNSDSTCFHLLGGGWYS